MTYYLVKRVTDEGCEADIRSFDRSQVRCPTLKAARAHMKNLLARKSDRMLPLEDRKRALRTKVSIIRVTEKLVEEG